MSWFLAALGIILLVVLHELGHFMAAKAVGMRVERFSLFFPPLLLRKKVGETEYAIGALPLGGYVKITGMNPSEELPDEVRTRAYYSQPVWKRIVVILAGPAMNLLIAFVVFVVFFWRIGAPTPAPIVDQVSKGFPASGVLQHGDRIVSVDGHRGSIDRLASLIAADRCAGGARVQGCRATRPVTLVVARHGRAITLRLTPVYDPAAGKTRLGFGYATVHKPLAFGPSVSEAGSQFVSITKATVSLPARVFNAQQRKQIHGIVGSYETTRQQILHDPGDAVGVIGIISLALAVVNLFPFLPLDGGHIFWALVELVRRRPVSYSTMERSGVVGFALVAMLALIGLTNDIHTLSNGGFGRR